MKQTRIRRAATRRGAALLTALAMLAILTALGVVYVDYMASKFGASMYSLRSLRAQTMAEAGYQAALGQLQGHLAKDDLYEYKGETLDIELPVYGYVKGSSELFSKLENRKGAVKVTITDENARVNLNCAPPRVLQDVLGVDGDVARRIRAALATADPATGASTWMVATDELVSRGWMTPDAYSKNVHQDLVTVYSVANLADPAGFLNVNSISPDLLASLLGISPQAALDAAAKRPFKSLADVAALTGKELSKEFCVQPRCFRIVSEAAISDVGGAAKTTRETPGRVEAVVLFDQQNKPQVMYWSQTPSRTVKAKA